MPEHHGHHPGSPDHHAHGPPSGVAQVATHGGHDKHAGHTVAMFRDKFLIALLLTIPILIWGHMLPALLGYEPPDVPGRRLIPVVLGTGVFGYGGRPFLEGAVRELRDRTPGMMTLIALAITVAFAFSAAVSMGFPGMPLWEEVATLITIMLLGHWLEMRSIHQAEGAVRQLAKLLPNLATRIRRDGVEERFEEIGLGDLRAGDLVLIRPGASVPTDGQIEEGASTIDESMITGESRPLERGAGEKVIAGTVNGAGSLRVRVTGTGEQTTLASIIRLVEQAQATRSRAQALADRAAALLTGVAVTAGIVTLVAWLGVGATPAYAVQRVVTVLVIACPHALGLAIPLVVAISTSLGAHSGLLVRDRRGLEEARLVDTVVFDKTGTLTRGEHRVVGLRTVAPLTDDEALRLGAAVEREAQHPVARAIVASAEEKHLAIPSAHDVQNIPGKGARATVSDRALAVGGPNLLEEMRIDQPAAFRELAAAAASGGRGIVYLVDGTEAIAAFVVADAIRPESKEAVDRLHQLGVEVTMLTGDARAVADAVAAELGIDRVYAQVLPEGKAALIQELKQQGKRVAMVGDGVNDAPALVTADVGIAIGAGTDVAVEAGDVVLVRSDPRDVARIIALSKATYRKMIQNLWWAAGYNMVAIPLAAGVLAPVGFLLSPAVGAILMSLSTIIVAINAQLLRRAPL